MSTIDQQFVEYIVKSLVEHPDDVSVERTIDERGVLLTLTVNSQDLGRVIGKRGMTAQSLRTLLRALGVKSDAHINLKIVNNDEKTEQPVENTPLVLWKKTQATLINLEKSLKNSTISIYNLDSSKTN